MHMVSRWRNFYYHGQHFSIQIYPALQRSHLVKSVRSQLNSEVEVVSMANGVYCCLRASLSAVLEHVVCIY